MCRISALCHTSFFSRSLLSRQGMYVCVSLSLYISYFFVELSWSLSFPEASNPWPSGPASLRQRRKNVRGRERRWAFQVSLLDLGCPFAGNGPKPRLAPFLPPAIFPRVSVVIALRSGNAKARQRDVWNKKRRGKYIIKDERARFSRQLASRKLKRTRAHFSIVIELSPSHITFWYDVSSFSRDVFPSPVVSLISEPRLRKMTRRKIPRRAIFRYLMSKLSSTWR